ncbi:MAG: hypothetical protein FJX84_09885 [Bacteroidetes bacterium]|nr:hypothetical protein [Bacteroidota bacterium]
MDRTIFLISTIIQQNYSIYIPFPYPSAQSKWEIESDDSDEYQTPPEWGDISSQTHPYFSQNPILYFMPVCLGRSEIHELIKASVAFRDARDCQLFFDVFEM